MKTRFTEEQIIGVLRKSKAGISTSELCLQNEVIDETDRKTFRVPSTDKTDS